LGNLIRIGRSRADVQLLDPFCGVGTGLLSAQTLQGLPYRITSIGIDCNPLAVFIARAKLAWPQVDPSHLLALAVRLISSRSRVSTGLLRLSRITIGRCLSW